MSVKSAHHSTTWSASLGVLALLVAAAASVSPVCAQSQGAPAALRLSVNTGFTSYRPYVSPILVAQALGYFKDAGVSVEIHTGTGSAGAVQAVAVGNDDLAWVDLATAAFAIGQGHPIISVSNTQPKGELGLISLKSSNITKPRDIIGKSIGSNPSGSDPVLLKLFLNANEIPASQVRIENAPGDARLALMLSNKIDLISGQGFDYETLLAAQGHDVNVILYGDHGANLIGHGFIANRDKAPSQGPAIKAFLIAYNKGLLYTKEHMTETCHIYLDTKVIGFTQAMCKQQLDGWLPLLNLPETQGKPVGWNSDKLWQETVDRLQKYGDTPAKPLATYYTNDYVPN